MADSSLFTDYVEHKLVYSKRVEGTPEEFRQTLSTFESLQCCIGLTRTFGALVPSFIKDQWIIIRRDLSSFLPIWRRGFNQLYFCPGLQQEKSSICHHASEFLRSWGHLLTSTDLQIAALSAQQCLASIRASTIDEPTDKARRRKKKQQDTPTVYYNQQADADKAAAALLAELETERQQKKLQQKQKQSKGERKIAEAPDSDAETYIESLLTCPLTQVKKQYLFSIVMMGIIWE